MMTEGSNNKDESTTSEQINNETGPAREMNQETIAITNNMIVNEAADQSTAPQPNKSSPNDPETREIGDTNKETTTKDEESEPSSNNIKGNESKQDDDPKNESSTLSTAFTISFEDDAPSNSKKLFGIRDSIRKFAPPKPHTIEKPRPPKSDGHENSYTSLESGRSSYHQARQTFRRDTYSSCRSSGRKSDSSRHSNISESAAFLIDKMLNCKQGESLSSICLESGEKVQKDKKTRSKAGGGTPLPVGKLAHSSGDILLDDEIDFCEEKSDNGTYIVGTDPESDAARRKIDELFGVVKAAEASLMASGKTSGKEVSKPPVPTSRASRKLDEKTPINRGRQEHINRLATGRHSSRSSSSSRQELASTSHRPRSTTRHSRNSSCERSSKLPNTSRHKRATSHSSRQSSNRDVSEGDTRSSRSSFHNDTEVTNSEIPSANNQSIKFNRAFALRRARLGLGEVTPTNRITSTPSSNGQDFESLITSPRRNINLSRYGHQSSSGGGGGGGGASQNLSRSDGGRFSLRMKNNPVPSRLIAGANESGRASQQGPIIDSYLSRLSSSNKFQRCPAQPSQTAAHQNLNHSANALPYQSSDELEPTSPSRFRRSNAKSSSSRKEQQCEFDIDSWDYCNEKLNYSFGMESENFKMVQGNGTCNSAGRRGSASQMGALDCLVISAISTLSVKIRSSVCDLMVEHAKRLPSENETRLIVEEILPQLTSNSSRPKSPTSIEEIDQSLYFDLAQTLKNLKKVEQMVDVMKSISNQIIDSPNYVIDEG
uniref:Uncharacterized protein n=1 Tax=Aceria tosichella TaxID=561515 RepID=A0A6G1SFM7_9ACAR